MTERAQKQRDQHHTARNFIDCTFDMHSYVTLTEPEGGVLWFAGWHGEQDNGLREGKK